MDLTGFGSIADLAGKVIDRAWPDPTEAAKIKVEMFKAEQAGALAELQAGWASMKDQAEINKVEAASTRLFVAGWRPFVGWVCGSALMFKYILLPFLVYIAALAGVADLNLPSTDFTDLITILLGLLGLGGLRTYEKVKKVG